MYDDWKYTTERLRGEIRRWRVSPEQARKKLTDIRDMIDVLLISSSDAERVRVVNKLRRRLDIGWAKIEYLAIYSKVAVENKEEYWNK